MAEPSPYRWTFYQWLVLAVGIVLAAKGFLLLLDWLVPGGW